MTSAHGRWLTWILLTAAVLCAFGRPQASETRDITLYYPHHTLAGLIAVQGKYPDAAALTDRLRHAVDRLLSGPFEKNVSNALSRIRLNQVFLDRNGTAFVDLAPDVSLTKVTDAKGEQLMLWAIVNTLCLNFGEVTHVKFLINGNEATSLSGHVDLSRPFRENRNLVIENVD